MREIKFRAFIKYTRNNKWDWAYAQAAKKIISDGLSGIPLADNSEELYLNDFLELWDTEKAAEEDECTTTYKMVADEEMSIYLNGKIAVRYGHEILNVCQYTGLKDKNGKEIYEGDILLIDDTYTEVVLDYGQGPEHQISHVVSAEFRDGSFGVFIRAGGNLFDSGFHSFSELLTNYVDSLDTFEVIGNIYENPELLKKSGEGKKMREIKFDSNYSPYEFEGHDGPKEY